jgi:hypothetical protein
MGFRLVILAKIKLSVQLLIYVDEIRVQYIKRVRDISNIHVFDRWRTNKLIPRAIGGHPVISKHLLRWIFSGRRFPLVTIQLEFHYTGNFVEEVNVADCLAGLTESTNTTREEMYEHQIIQEYLLKLQVVAEAENVINICDKSTWGDHDLSKLKELVWNDIGPIPCHTQYMENVVQTSGWVGKNNRGEKRRSYNGRLHSFIVRDTKALHFSEKRSSNPLDTKQQLGNKEF